MFLYINCSLWAIFKVCFTKLRGPPKKKLKWAPYGSLATTHIPGVDKLFAKHARKDKKNVSMWLEQCENLVG